MLILIVYAISVTIVSFGLVFWLLRKPSYKPVVVLTLLQILMTSLFIANNVGGYALGTLPIEASKSIIIATIIVEIFWRLIFPQMIAIIGVRKYRKLS